VQTKSFFFVFTKSLSSSCFTTLVVIDDWLINSVGLSQIFMEGK